MTLALTFPPNQDILSPMLPPLPVLAFLDILSGPELIVVLAVVLIFFGGDKMPEFARGLGKVVREFRKAAGDVEREFKRVIEEVEHPVNETVNTIKPVLTAPPDHPPEPFNPPSYHPDEAAPEHPAATGPAGPAPAHPIRNRSEPPAMPEI